MPFLDVDSWARKEHFHFFRTYTQPYFDLCAPVDVTELRRRTGAAQAPSFSLAAFWLSLRAVNEVPELRYRLRGEKVWEHETVGGGATVLRDDETFGFAYFSCTPDYTSFAVEARPAIEAVKRSGRLEPRPHDDALVHYSVIPWVSFTSFAHARPLIPGDAEAGDAGAPDSVPKLVFGRYYPEGEGWRMPVSISLHHALADGLHAGRFFERFQELLDDPPLD
ncbi:MAG: CatA-like O-acetyltransferase [Holophagales bacterium]|nr:CatA-like O-acetyltransferase [Holophagales bacterium]